MTLPQAMDDAAAPLLPPISAEQIDLFASVFGGASPSGQPALEGDYRDHLAGARQLTLGPSSDGRVGFAVFDFRRRNATTWKADATQFASDARRCGVAVYLESQPLRNPGFQAWIFFAAPLPVAQARWVAGGLLDRVSEGDPRRFPSFGRVFPADPSGPAETVPLPLFGGLRAAAEGLFVARERGFPAFADQWALLASVARVDLATAGRLAPDAGLQAAPPGPCDHVDAVLSASLVLRRPLPAAIASRLRQRLSYPNAEYVKRVREGRRVRGIPRLLPGWRRLGDAWVVPGGLESELRAWCQAEGVGWRLLDVRARGAAVPRPVPPGLPTEARTLLDTAMTHERAMVVASDDFTRTAVALAAVAERGVPTLIVAQMKARAEYWRDQALLGGFEESEVTTLREALVRPVPLAICTFAEVPAQAGRLDTRFAMVVADDCMRVPMLALRESLRCLPVAWVLGLADKGRRDDGQNGLLEILVGPAVRAVPADDEALLDVVLRTTRFVYQGPASDPDAGEMAEVDAGDDGGSDDELFSMARPPGPRVIPTPPPARSRDWLALLDAISHDEPRNQLVAGDVATEAGAGQRCLVLTERREHAQNVTDLLGSRGVPVALLTGAIPVGRRREALEQFREGKVQVLVVMEQLLGPGFDPSAVSRVFLAAPLRGDARLRQTIESLQRGHRGVATIRLYDYVDDAVPRLARMATARRRFFARAKTTLNPEAMQLRLPFD